MTVVLVAVPEMFAASPWVRVCSSRRCQPRVVSRSVYASHSCAPATETDDVIKLDVPDASKTATDGRSMQRLLVRTATRVDTLYLSTCCEMQSYLLKHSHENCCEMTGRYSFHPEANTDG